MPEARRSFAARMLPLVTWGLTFHIVVIAILFGLVHLPATTVRVIAAWKETVLGLLVVATVARTALGRGPRLPLAAADLTVAALVGLALVAALVENTVFNAGISLRGAALGFRDVALFLGLYFVGRAAPDIADERVLRRSFAVLLVTSAIAIAEQIFVSPEMLVALGVASYVRDFLGLQAHTTGNMYGLPDNYWSMMGNHFVRRSGSVFLSGQGFATSFLVLFPGATLWVLSDDAPPTPWRRLGYAAIWIGLLVSFTRSVIVICAVELALVQLTRRRPTGVALFAAAALLVVLAGLALVPGLATFLFETLTWQSGSSQSHLQDWTRGIIAFLRQPWGYGLGTADQTAARLGLTPITSDNLYLKYAVELGLPGLATLLAMLATIAGASWRAVGSPLPPAQRRFALMVAVATVGLVLDGATDVVFGNPIVSYLYFWFAGAAVALAASAAREPVGAGAVVAPALAPPAHA